jgi:hypothetical protein
LWQGRDHNPIVGRPTIVRIHHCDHFLILTQVGLWFVWYFPPFPLLGKLKFHMFHILFSDRLSKMKPDTPLTVYDGAAMFQAIGKFEEISTGSQFMYGEKKKYPATCLPPLTS